MGPSLRRIAAITIAALTLAVPTAAQRAKRPAPAVEYNFQFEQPAEGVLELHASAPGASWAKAGAEAAVLRVSVDGVYNQHVTLFAGGDSHLYAVLLGPLAAGAHRVEIRLDPLLSAAGARTFLADALVRPVAPGNAEYEAIRYAPILYARADTLGRASDTPLIAFYEWIPPGSDGLPGADRALRYSYVFSNEDGGTNTPALLARWGRTTDIEHVYRLFLDKGGNVLGAIFQGIEHKETPFQGEKLGSHLLIGVASRNNNFDDKTISPVRTSLLPVSAELAGHSREEVMDRNPWSWEVMAAEMEREGKTAEIGDLRHYAYLEADIHTAGSEATFGVELNDGRTFRADNGRDDRRIDRSGWVRSATRLPAGVRLADIKRILFFCEATAKPPSAPVIPTCEISALSKVFMLGRDYRPGPSLSAAGRVSRRLAPGQSAAFEIAK